MKKTRPVAYFFVLSFAFFIADYCSKWVTDATDFSELAERLITFAINVVIIYIATAVFAKLWPEKAKEAKTEEANKEPDAGNE